MPSGSRTEAAAALGIAPEVAAGDESCLVTRFVVCSPIDADRLRSRPGPVARGRCASFTTAACSCRPASGCRSCSTSTRRSSLSAAERCRRSIRRAVELAARIADALPLSDPVPCHNDLLAANLLSVASADGAGDSVMLVDWEYAGMGHRMFDLGNLAVNNEFDEAAEERLLVGYYGEPPGPDRTAALRLMRLMSDAREGAWGVVQGVLSELDFDFAAYASHHLERLVAAAEDPRFEQWLETASA